MEGGGPLRQKKERSERRAEPGQLRVLMNNVSNSMWHGYEQVYASKWQRNVKESLCLHVNAIRHSSPLQRWEPSSVTGRFEDVLYHTIECAKPIGNNYNLLLRAMGEDE